MTPDIEEALNYWRAVNAKSRRWATFEAIQFEHHRVVRVDVGDINLYGEKERVLLTRNFVLTPENEVHEIVTVHP